MINRSCEILIRLKSANRAFISSLLFVGFLGVPKSQAQQSEQAYRISVKIEGISDSVAYLGYHYGDQKYIRDTAVVENSTATFSGDSDLPKGVYFFYTSSIFLELIVKEQRFTVQSDTADLLANFQVTGSYENEVFSQFKLFMAQSQVKFKDFSDQLAKASDQEDSLAVQNDITDLNTEILEFKTSFSYEPLTWKLASRSAVSL